MCQGVWQFSKKCPQKKKFNKEYADIICGRRQMEKMIFRKSNIMWHLFYAESRHNCSFGTHGATVAVSLNSKSKCQSAIPQSDTCRSRHVLINLVVIVVTVRWLGKEGSGFKKPNQKTTTYYVVKTVNYWRDQLEKQGRGHKKSYQDGVLNPIAQLCNTSFVVKYACDSHS